MSVPKDKSLYNYVKSLANKKFKSPTGVYRSSWIVKEYKKRGGSYSKSKTSGSSGLKRWYKEKWVDLNRPIRSRKTRKIIGYKPCGRSNKSEKRYPACRPSRRVNKKTPKTYKQISKSRINKSKKLKAVYKSRRNVKW
jgi:hypothetical protein